MALIVEDGTGKVDSESYVAIADADTYWTNRGDASWGADDAAKEVALRKATDYIEQLYRGLWNGSRVTGTQALSWPRTGVVVDGFDVPTTLVPTEVRYATIELAKRAITTELLPDVTATSGEVIKEKLGELEVQYSAGSSTGATGTLYKTASKWLSPFLMGGIGSIRSINVLRA